MFLLRNKRAKKSKFLRSLCFSPFSQEELIRGRGQKLLLSRQVLRTKRSNPQTQKLNQFHVTSIRPKINLASCSMVY